MFRLLLDPIGVHETGITADSLHVETGRADCLRRLGADYILAVAVNQPSLLCELESGPCARCQPLAVASKRATADWGTAASNC